MFGMRVLTLLENIDISSIDFNKKPMWERGEPAFDPEGTATVFHMTDWIDRSYAFDESDLSYVCKQLKKILSGYSKKSVIVMDGIDEYTPQFTIGMISYIFTNCLKTFESYRSRLRFKGGTDLFKHYKRIAEEKFYRAEVAKKKEKQKIKDKKIAEKAFKKRQAKRKEKETKKAYYQKNQGMILCYNNFAYRGVRLTREQIDNYFIDRGHLEETYDEAANAIKSGEYIPRPSC